MKKLSLYLNTLRYLKWIQIRYQFVHRLRQIFFSVTAYKKFIAYPLYPVLYKHGPCIVSQGLYTATNCFRFLNIEKAFGDEVEWNFQGYGKLWNYNLQYFDYLDDMFMTDEKKTALVNDFSDQLLQGKIKAEPFPVSIRLVNWMLFFSRTGFASENFSHALRLQAGYLEKNIEYHLLANHLLENYFTLAICGVCFRDEAMTKKYLDRIVRELALQLSDDGGHIEGSPMYHCLILSRVLLLIDIAEANGSDNRINSALRSKAAMMLGWLESFCNGNDSYPMLNDASAGIAPTPGRLFGLAKTLGLSWQRSALKGSGYRRLSVNGVSLLIDVAEIIPSYQPGHAHSDMLHFTMEYNGAPIFTEAGTSTYENNDRRKYERSTAAHNTVVVNNTNQSQVWSSFRVARRAGLTLHKDERTLVSASHDGYLHKHGIIHTRTFSVAESGSIVINDILQVHKKMPIKAVALFHLHPSVSVHEIGTESIILSNGIQLLFENSTSVEVLTYQHATGFNALTDAEKIMVSFTKTLQTQILIQASGHS